jgi:hypothetical protein
MESKIRVTVDFNRNNAPVIEIVRKNSEDVRDHLVCDFLEKFQSHNRWAKVVYMGEDQQARILHYHIIPISMDELRDEIVLMQAFLDAPRGVVENPIS